MESVGVNLRFHVRWRLTGRRTAASWDGNEEAGPSLSVLHLPTTQASLTRRFSTLPAARVALEVGAHSRWVSPLLTQLGHEVLVAGP